MAHLRFPARRPVTWAVLAAMAVAATVGLELFQPWKLWIDQTVNEASPPTAIAPATPGPAGGSGRPGPTAAVVVEPAVLARGTFVSHEHTTTGSVSVLVAADATRYLRLENLDTSNGPLLEVWLTDAPVLAGTDGWYVFDDGQYVSLGPLKGNRGSQNYPLPASLDLGRYRSVSVWCARFHVSFGAAELSL